MKKIKFLDLKKINIRKQKELTSDFKRFLNSGWYIGSTEVKQFENKFSKYCKTKFCVGVANGLDAIFLILKAYNIGKGDEVIVPSNTYIASWLAVTRTGAKIIPVEPDISSYNIDHRKILEKITSKTKAIIVVHLYGQTADMDPIMKISKKYNLKVIEDAAQAFLSKVNSNGAVGVKYDIGCFSLSITKPIHMVYGGFCTTNSNKLADKLRAIRNNGVNSKPENARLELASEMGLNLKPSDLHSSIGIANIENLKHQAQVLKKIHNLYKNTIKNKKINFLEVKGKYSTPCYNQVLVDNREKFMKFCYQNSVGLHLGIRCLSETDINIDNGNYDNSLFLSRNLVRLPSGPGYNLTDISNIIKIINRY